jgi:hypothetical protein
MSTPRPGHELRRLFGIGLLALLCPLAAHAEANWLHWCARATAQESPCAMPYAEGLAAVHVAVPGTYEGLWGFVDQQARMVIPPAYDDPASFHGGTAVVRRFGKQGIINTQGQWLVQPTFEAITRFSASGAALAVSDGLLYSIDRQGRSTPLATPSPPARIEAEESDEATGLTVARIDPPPHIWNLRDGHTMPLPPDVTSVQPQKGGPIAAARRMPSGRTWWGMLDQEGRWAVPADILRSDEMPVRDGDIIAIHRGGRWLFSDLHGQALGPDTYHSVELMRPGSWWVDFGDGHVEIQSPALQRRLRLPDGASMSNREDLGTAVGFELDKSLYLIRDGGQIQQWPLEGRVLRWEQGHAWLLPSDDDQADGNVDLPQVITPDGQALLDKDTSSRLHQYRIDALSNNDQRPIALAQLLPHDPTDTPALLTHEGKIVTRPDWLTLRENSEPGEPWVVQTRQGLFGAINREGRWVIEPQWAALEGFHRGLAWARRMTADGQERRELLTTTGQVMPTTPAVQKHCTRWMGAVLSCVDFESPDLRSYFWDPVSQKTLMAGQISDWQQTDDKLLLARQGELWGLLDERAGWVVTPRYAKVEQVRGIDAKVLMETQTISERARYRLLRRDNGQPLSDWLPKAPERLTDDRYLLEPSTQGGRVIDSSGRTVVSTAWRMGSHEVEGPWLRVWFDDQYGLMRPDGHWAIEPLYRRMTIHSTPRLHVKAESNGEDPVLLDPSGNVLNLPPEGTTNDQPPREAAQPHTEVSCQHVIIRNQRGQVTWPPYPVHCNVARKGKP